MHFKIVNNTDIDLPLNYEFVTHGMKIPTSAVTTSDNLSLTDLDIYPGDGVDGATTIFILPKKDISPNEVCEIWIDLSQCKLYDKTLYEDFSKKVDLSNGLPTNSTLDKDKNGHDVYAGGKNGNSSKKVGYVPGKHIVERVTVKYRAEFPKRLETMRDEILKEAGF